MKKRIVSLLLGVCLVATMFVGCGSGDNSKGTTTSYKDELLKDYSLFSQETETQRGKTISYFDEYRYQAIQETYVNDEFESGFCNRYNWECNKDGKPIKGTIENGTIIEIEYDKKGNKIKEITSIEIEGEIRTIQEQEYDEYGAITRIWQYIGDGIETIYDYKYNKDGKVEEVIAYADWHEEQYSQDYSVDSTEMWGTEITEPQEYQYMFKYVYSYNDDGIVETITEYDCYGNPLNEISAKGILLKEYHSSDEIEWEHILDENGNIVSYIDYDNDVTGEILEEYDYEYNEDGYLSKMYCYDGNGSCLFEGSCEYKFDENGVPTEIKIYTDGKLSGKLDCDVQYDTNGNLIHESKYIPYFGDETLKIDYGYDSKGNTIKELVYRDKDTIICGYEIIVSEDKNSVTIVEYSQGTNYGDTSKSTRVYLKKGTDFESLLDNKEIEINKLLEELEVKKAKKEVTNAYISYIQQNMLMGGFGYVQKDLDNNGIPEIIYWGSTAAGCGILSYYDGNVIDNHLESGSICFIEGENKIALSYGRMGYYGDRLYHLENGELIVDDEGNYSEVLPEFVWQDITFEYELNGEIVSADEYKKFFDDAIYEVEGRACPGDGVNAEQIISYLRNLY